MNEKKNPSAATEGKSKKVIPWMEPKVIASAIDQDEDLQKDTRYIPQGLDDLRTPILESVEFGRLNGMQLDGLPIKSQTITVNQDGTTTVTVILQWLSR